MAQITMGSGPILAEAMAFALAMREHYEHEAAKREWEERHTWNCRPDSKLMPTLDEYAYVKPGPPGTFDAPRDGSDPCADLLSNLKHFLGWGGEQSEKYTLRLSGHERDDAACRFYMNWTILQAMGDGQPAKHRMNGCIMYRDHEWSSHS
jgi:hypothetical protein